MSQTAAQRQATPECGGLIAHLDVELPAEIEVGRGTALFVCGWCYHPRARVRRLWFALNGRRQPVAAARMPRLDPFAELHPGMDPYDAARLVQDPASGEDPGLRSYRSGFWGLVRIEPGERRAGALSIALDAELDDGATAHARLGTVAIAGTGTDPLPRPPRAPPGEGPLVAICMATHNPPADLLGIQLDSIRAQTHRRWVCVISDDASDPDRRRALERAVADDDRFVVSRAPARLGFYRNFERALRMAPADAELVALSDQDDRWHEDKLETLLAGRGDAELVYCDARLVTRGGELISPTYWSRRRPNHHDMLSLLVANSVSGSASLFRRELLDDALPFPPAQFAHYHDHWLALVARARGTIAFVDRPLYDYVQHGQASLGHDAANRMPRLRDRLLRRAGRSRVRMWRMHYFVDVWRLQQCVAILRMRCAGRIGPESDRVLARFAGAERSPAEMATLAGRGLLELGGRRNETLGAEWMLFAALAWRRLLVASARERPRRGLRLDAVPPPDLAPRVRRPTGTVGDPAARAVAAKIAPLELAVSPAAAPRVNLLVPTIDLEHFFGGYIGKFNLAARLARAGLRVRVVTVDPTGGLPRGWRQEVESYAGLRGAMQSVEVAFGREQSPLDVNPADRFIATTWWTAHVADAATRQLGDERFLYLIQEYEPFTFPMGTHAALAEQSYTLAHFGLFSSELLRDYFRRHRIGVFAGAGGEDDSAAFQNAITAVPAPTVSELAARTRRRLLFYARPEAHAARNLFELGVLGLMAAVQRGSLAGWELNGIGSVQGGGELALGDEAVLRLRPRVRQRDYAAALREHDVGVALMHTPHPSLVPMEMASAGMLTVTSSFENKTAEAMAAISANLIAVVPTVEAIAEAIHQAAAGSADHERRVRGSAVRWSRDWDETFDEALVARLARELSPPR